MTIRLMRATHYQAGHPIYFGFLVHSCTSALQARSNEKVAKDVHKILNEHGYKCSREAAKFLVRMAQEMNFLGPNNIWTWKAFVINYFEEMDKISDCYEKTVVSSLTKKIIYLKYYLESDGALLIKFARKVLEENGLSKHMIRFTNQIVEPVFEETLCEYLSVETDFKKRVWLKKFLDMIREKGYQTKVHIHKAFAHLDPLVDLGILDYDAEKRQYQPKITDSRNITEVFIKKFPDILSLEKIFSNESAGKADVGYYERAAEVYNIPYRKFSQEDITNISEEIEKIYSKVRDTITGLAPIKSIKDIICTLGLVNHKVLCEWPNIDDVLKEFKKEKGAKLRFHVDRAGKVEYIVLSK